MNSLLRWCGCVLAALLSSCAGGYVAGRYTATVYDLDTHPSIHLREWEHGVSGGPCGFTLSRWLWEIGLFFKAQPNHVFDVRRADPEFQKLVGIAKNWSEGTISVFPERRCVEVRLYRTERGKKIPWEHNGTYRYRD